MVGCLGISILGMAVLRWYIYSFIPDGIGWFIPEFFFVVIIVINLIFYRNEFVDIINFIVKKLKRKND